MIKYECDVCEAEVYEAEAVGPGVYTKVGDDTIKGKVYTYDDPKTGLTLVIATHDMNKDGEHFCYACMWRAIKNMVELRAPKDEVDAEDIGSGESSDIELSQLFTEGVLSETGPDIPADDPGPYRRYGPPLDNFDPGPTPEAAWASEQRPGWRHQSQLRFGQRDNAQPRLPGHYG